MDDQRLLNQHYFSGKNAKMELDCDAQYFFSMIDRPTCGSSVRRYSLRARDGRIEVTIEGTRSRPCVIGGPAGANIGQFLGLPERRLSFRTRIGRSLHYARFILPALLLIPSLLFFLWRSVAGSGIALILSACLLAALALFGLLNLRDKAPPGRCVSVGRL
jgi:hypothetical protein